MFNIVEICKYINIIDLLNINVYLTNILLIPSIIFIYLIIQNITYMNDNCYKCKQDYLHLWTFIFIFFIISFIISTIHHIFMFSNYIILNKIGNIDYKFTAPFIAFIILILTIIYSIFIKDTQYTCNKYYTIFVISIIFNLFGLSIYFLRKCVLPRKITNQEKILYTLIHTCFHYITYTGILLLIFLHYLNYEYIYKTIYIL